MPVAPNDYIDNAYTALHDNLQGFNKTPDQFRQLVTSDPNYRNNVYAALKDNLQGFNKTLEDFNNSVIGEKKSPVGSTNSQNTQQGSTNGAQGSSPSQSQAPSQSSSGSDVLSQQLSLASQNIGNKQQDYDPGMQTPYHAQVAIIKQQQPNAVVPVSAQHPDGIDYTKVKAPAQVKQDFTDNAVLNTALRKMQADGHPYDKDDPTSREKLQTLKDFYNGQLKNGGASLFTDGNGQPGLRKVANDNVVDATVKAYNKTNQESDDADNFVNNMSTKDRVDFYNQKQKENINPEYLGNDNTSNWQSLIGDLLGGNAKFIAKKAAGGLIGGAVATVAPEALSALPVATSFLATGKDSADKGAMSEVLRRYPLIKQQHPDWTDDQAMKEAEKGMTPGMIAGAGTDAIFSEVGDPVASAPVNQGAADVLVNGIKKTFESGLDMGSKSAAITVLKEEAGKAQGINQSTGDVLKDAIDDFKTNMTIGMILHGTTALLGTAAPAVLKGAFKYAAINSGPELTDIKNTLDKSEQDGKIPPGLAANVVADLEEYKKALTKVPENVPEERKATIAQLIQDKDKIQQEATTKDKVFQETTYKPQLAAIDEQIKNVIATGKTGEEILSPKTENNEEASNNASAETEGQKVNTQGAETPNETAPISEKPVSDNIQPTETFRTLNYGDHTGEPESKEAQDKIKQDILDDKPIGNTGEKFSDFVKRVVPTFKDIMDKDPNNTTLVTHSSVIKALDVWEDMGRPDIDKLTPEQSKEFAEKYNAETPAKEGNVTTFKGDNGNEIHAVRHGETEDNQMSEFRSNDTQLTDKGEKQAQQAGQELKEKTGGDVPKIITSDLPRTIHTSNIIHGEINGEANSENKQGEQSTTKADEPNAAPNEGEQPTKGGEETTGIKKAKTLEERGKRNLQPIALKKLGNEGEILKQGKENVDSGKIDPRQVVDRVIKENGIYSPDEAGAMQYYAHQLKGEEENIRDEISKAPKDSDERLNSVNKLQQLSDEVDNFTKANRINSRSWGQLGNVMQIEADQSFSPSLNREVIRENYGGEIPKEVKSKLDEALRMRDAAIEELKQAQEKYAAESIKKDSTLEERQSKRKATKEELKKERDNLLDEFKKKDDNAPTRNSTSPLTDKQVQILGKLAINYFKDGVVTINDIADKIWEDVKDKIDGITKSHIKDAVASYPQLKEVAKQKEIERLSRKEADVNKQLETGKLKEPPKQSDIVFKKTNDMIKAEQRIAKAEYAIKKLKQESFESKKNMFQKGLGWAGRLVRLSVLSGTNVLYKLSSAAVIGGAAKRIPEQVLGGIYSQVFKGIADKAPIEGYFNAKSEAQFYKEFFNPKKIADNTAQIFKTGESRLSQKFNPDAHEHIPGLYLPTDLHQIIKDPLKRATYEASFRNALINAEKNGYDIKDPLIINSIENAAYKRANYEIFQESNALSRKFGQWKNEMEKKGNVGATGKFVADFLIPVSTVPTNIARRLGITSPFGLVKASYETVMAYRKGLENLKPEEADQVMRQLKQGSLGTALWLTGWFGYKSLGGLYTQFNPDKKRMQDLKSDQMLVNGKMVPKPVQHALPMEIAQLAATARRIWEERSEQNNNFERVFHTALATIGAATSDIPILETGAHLLEATQSPQGAEKLKKDAESRFEPTILKETGVIKPDKKK